MFRLRYYQNDARERIREMFDSYRSTACVMPTATGKCLAKSTPVIMWDGTVKPVDDVRVGDLLVGPNSQPRRVLSTTRGREMMYRVTPTKGDPYTVNASHILSLKLTPDGRGDGEHLLVNLTVAEYLKKSNWFKHRAKGWRTEIHWPEAAVPLDPYFLGLWLGDGHHKRPQITTADPEIVAYLAEFSDKVGLRLHRESYAGRCDGYAVSGVKQRWKANPVTAAMRSLGVFGNKHIPLAYLRNSRRVRLELLAGLIDSDGHLCRAGGYEITAKSYELASQIAFLARSLGFAAYIRAKQSTCQTGAVGVYYRLHLSGRLSNVPVKLGRKRHPVLSHAKDVLVHGIGVEPVGDGDYYGFTLDGDGLFLLGDFTVTHNTELYLSVAVEEVGRVLAIVHRDYLITSPAERLARVGFTDVAVEKAEQRAERSGRRAKIVFASVQSIGPERQAHRLKEFDPRDFSLLIIDEGHRAVASIYRRVIEYMQAGNPRLKVLILTATPKRKDGIALGNVCESVAYEMTPGQAAEEGWIARPRFFKRDVPELDFSKVNLRGTDLDPDQVAAMILEEKPLHTICASLAEFQGPTIVFCPRVDVAHAFAAVLNHRYRRDKAMAVHADSTDEEMEAATKGLADGSIDWVLNVDKLTEGYDVPKVVRVAWAAPTASLVRWTQGCGRGFRPDAGVAKLLVGNRDDAPTRRLLIEQSAKPFCEIVTYYPSNCQHQICSAVDLLGGHAIPADLKKYAEQVQEETCRQGGGSDTEHDIDTAKVFIDLRSALDARRREIKAKAVVRDTEYDGLGQGGTRKQKDSVGRPAAETAMAATASWGEGEAATAKQLGWFRFKGVRDIDAYGLTKFRASVVRDLFEMGVKVQTALGYGRKQALKVRDEMRNRQTGEAIPE